MWSRFILLAAFMLISGMSQSASAARLLQVYVELDGTVVAHMYYEDNGRADAATVWRYLQHDPIMVDDDVTNLAGDPGDPLTVTLAGDIVLRFQHSSRVIAQARLTDLTLRRADAQSQQWTLTPAEVERTAGLAGLGPPGAPPVDPLWYGLTGVGAVAALVLVGIVGVVFLLFRRSRSVSTSNSG